MVKIESGKVESKVVLQWFTIFANVIYVVEIVVVGVPRGNSNEI